MASHGAWLRDAEAHGVRIAATPVGDDTVPPKQGLSWNSLGWPRPRPQRVEGHSRHVNRLPNAPHQTTPLAEGPSAWQRLWPHAVASRFAHSAEDARMDYSCQPGLLQHARVARKASPSYGPRTNDGRRTS